MTDQQVAVLIDYENVGLGSIQWLFDQISDIGRISVRRAYADWSSASSKRDQLLELGIEPIQLFHSTKSGKNSSDIRLAIDAVDLLYQSPVNTLVIVSSDSDFVPLVSRLRAAGKTVIGAGQRDKAPAALVKSCDRYFYLDRIDKSPSTKLSSQASPTDSLLRRAVLAAMDEQGMVIGSKLHQTLQRLDPAFDFRAQGYSTFGKYLDASSEVNVIRPRGKADVSVELMPVKKPQVDESFNPEAWGPKIDNAWSRRAEKSGLSIPGTTAAADAGEALGVAKLSASPYKTLQRLLDAIPQLRMRWLREGNKIIRK